MLVGGVLVVELVLDQAGELAEVRNVSAQQADLMHGPEDGRHVAALVEDLKKRFADMFVIEKGPVQQRQIAANQLREVGMELEAALLRVEKHPHEPSRLVLEDPR